LTQQPAPPPVPAAMADVKLKYLLRETNRHGRAVWYVRIGTGPRVRVASPGPEDAGFAAAYTAALATLLRQPAAPPAPRREGVRPGSVDAAINAYVASASLSQLDATGQRRHRATLARVSKAWGREPLARLTPALLESTMAAMTPGAATAWRKQLRRWMAWCAKHRLADSNPMLLVDPVQAASPGGYTPWTWPQVEARRAIWPVGSMPRLALEMFLNLAPRRSEAVRIGLQHYTPARTVVDEDGIVRALPARIRYTPPKTERSSAVLKDLPVTPELAECLALIDRGNSFQLKWREWQEAAGLPEAINLHGARKLAAETAAENGCTVAEIMAILGHTSTAMARHYARNADRARQADAAFEKLSRTRTRTPSPAPVPRQPRTGQ
jgi:integrase